MSRPQDLTRLKKTYSFARQVPVSLNLNVVHETRSRDLTRFRKVHTSFRQDPIVTTLSEPTQLEYITTEADDVLTTEAGDRLITED